MGFVLSVTCDLVDTVMKGKMIKIQNIEHELIIKQLDNNCKYFAYLLLLNIFYCGFIM